MVEQLTTLNGYLFFGMVILLAVLELIIPAKQLTSSVNTRWTSNIGLFLFNSSMLRFLIPVSALVVSQFTVVQKLGILNLLPLNQTLVIIIALLSLDLLYYWLHRLFHRFRVLWHLHLIHHTDIDVDFTTSERHHPLETVISAGLLFIFIVMMGIPPVAILLYAVAKTVVVPLSHSNLRFLAPLEKILALIVVTPAVHAVHHSVDKQETDSNFGVVLTVWDRVFHTYRELKPGMVAPARSGLEYFRAPKDGRFLRLLYLPLIPIPVDEEVEFTQDPHQAKPG